MIWNKGTNNSARRLNPIKFNIVKNGDEIDTNLLQIKFSSIQTARALDKDTKSLYKTDNSFDKSISKHKNSSEISIYAQKENESMMSSLKFLDNRTSHIHKNEQSIYETEKLLEGTKSELVALSNRLSKIVAK